MVKAQMISAQRRNQRRLPQRLPRRPQWPPLKAASFLSLLLQHLRLQLRQPQMAPASLLPLWRAVLPPHKGLDLASDHRFGPTKAASSRSMLKTQLPRPKAESANSLLQRRHRLPAASAYCTSWPLGGSWLRKMYEGRDYEEVSLDGMRKTIAARLSEAKQTIPHFYLRRDIQLDALLKFRSAAEQTA